MKDEILNVCNSHAPVITCTLRGLHFPAVFGLIRSHLRGDFLLPVPGSRAGLSETVFAV